MDDVYDIPIRRISPEEILEFVEFINDHSDFAWFNADRTSEALTDLVCHAALGNLVLSLPERSLALLIQLKWGRDVTNT